MIYNQEIIVKNPKCEVTIRINMITVIEYINSKLENTRSIDINDYLFLISNIIRPYHLGKNRNY